MPKPLPKARCTIYLTPEFLSDIDVNLAEFVEEEARDQAKYLLRRRYRKWTPPPSTYTVRDVRLVEEVPVEEMVRQTYHFRIEWV